MNDRYPFLFGAQYYRAPTPEPECWAQDFARMRDLGFTDVKYWVQWRCSQRTPDSYFFDDLDRLMELASAHDLRVTLNTILDVAPIWLYEHYPDAKQRDNSGHSVEPYAAPHRQLGGHPGPCYNHPGALAVRQGFMEAAIAHFKHHPALLMWDVWNEPEMAVHQRTPNIATLVCYCAHCHQGFLDWLQRKYAALDQLNQIWGRCYSAWSQVELPRVAGTINDFIDWREFHLDTMTREAQWRLASVAEHDPRHARYLHIVPYWFNAVTCVDNFAVAEPCEVFAATMNGGPVMASEVISAAAGKRCYNVESHINFGNTDLHQPIVDERALRRNLLPQIGLGVKGFLFWQYRAETLGMESPAWGLVRPDGSDRPVTRAAQAFWSRLAPHTPALLDALPAPATVGLWASRKNEIFHFATQDTVRNHAGALEKYITALYWRNIPFRWINETVLTEGDLTQLKLIIMPSCYYLTEEQATALDRWVRGGGVLLNEAHLAGYNGTTGRHSRRVPGIGLAERWGIYESESTSSFHLAEAMRHTLDAGMTEDVKKAMTTQGVAGGKYFPIRLAEGTLVWGAHRYATLAGDDLIPLGSLDGISPCLARKAIGAGHLVYCGTNFGQAAEHDTSGLQAMLQIALDLAGLRPTRELQAETPHTVHLDVLSHAGQPRFTVLINNTDDPQPIRLQGRERWQGGFTETNWALEGEFEETIPGGFAELFVVE